MIDAKALTLVLEFVPSHLDDEKKRSKGYATCDYAVHNNMVADYVAELTAKQVCLLPSITAKVLYYHKLVKSIQRRLYVILWRIAKRDKLDLTSCPCRGTMTALMNALPAVGTVLSNTGTGASVSIVFRQCLVPRLCFSSTG